jgi:hypothetical protein
MVRAGLGPKKSSERKRTWCDLCLLVGIHTPCVKEGDGICTTCHQWGLPCCSYTTGFRGEKGLQDNKSKNIDWSPEGWATYHRVKEALHSLPLRDASSAVFNQTMIVLKGFGVEEDSEDEGVEDSEAGEDGEDEDEE